MTTSTGPGAGAEGAAAPPWGRVTTPLGEVLRDPAGMRLEFVRSYDQPVAEVWAALVEPERMARWFGTWTGDPSTGTVDLVMTEEEGATPSPVTIVACDPPHRLVVDVSGPDGSWPLAVTLREHDGGTELTFVHRLAEPYDASNIGPGWHWYLDRLGAVAASTPVPGVWDDYYPALQGGYGLPG